MKVKIAIFLSICLSMLLLYSCTKLFPTSSFSVFTKSISFNKDYNASSCLQLSDGSFIVAAYHIDFENKAKLIKYDVNGNLLWVKDLPKGVSNLWKMILLQNNHLGFLGFDSSYSNANLFLYELDTSANIIHDATISSGSACIGVADMIQLSNKNIAVVHFGRDTALNMVVPVIHIFDPNFNLQVSNMFKCPNQQVPPNADKGFMPFKLKEIKDGNIMIIGSVDQRYFSGVIPSLFTIKCSPPLYKSIALNVSRDSTVGETLGDMMMYGDGSFIAPISRYKNKQGNGGAYINYHTSTVVYSCGEIGLSFYDANSKLYRRNVYSNYQQNGYINSIKSTSDGGYILVGTANQIGNPAIVSHTHIYLLKLDASFNEQWSQELKTSYPSYGIDVIQTKDFGYLVSAHQRSFNNQFDLLLIKTDPNGTMVE
jgi:hypothetical protein